MVKSKTVELNILKGILWVYIILCLIIAGLNYGYADKATPEVADLISSFWHLYENWIKTAFIIAGSILTLRIVRADHSSMRRKNLIGFIIAALVVHIAGPVLLDNNELYFFAMPLPWTTTPLQLLDPQSSFYLSRVPVWGSAVISASLVFYLGISIVVFGGTILFGRRWQCSTLCLFNGFAAEVFDLSFPLLGKKGKMTQAKLAVFSWLRWLFLIGALFFTVSWIMHLSGVSSAGNMEIISNIELYKYLGAELLMMMFFWIAFVGRGYCYYCPMGTVLAIIGRVSGQRIITNKTRCIRCNQCNLACSMSIDIISRAQEGNDVTSLRCVGCGHCIDACSTSTLAYSTKFLSWFTNKKVSNTSNEAG